MKLLKRIGYLSAAIIADCLHINILPQSKPKTLSEEEINKRIQKVVESIKLDLEHGRDDEKY